MAFLQGCLAGERHRPYLSSSPHHHLHLLQVFHKAEKQEPRWALLWGQPFLGSPGDDSPRLCPRYCGKASPSPKPGIADQSIPVYVETDAQFSCWEPMLHLQGHRQSIKEKLEKQLEIVVPAADLALNKAQHLECCLIACTWHAATVRIRHGLSLQMSVLTVRLIPGAAARADSAGLFVVCIIAGVFSLLFR